MEVLHWIDLYLWQIAQNYLVQINTYVGTGEKVFLVATVSEAKAK